ncbi:Glutathione synthase/Ribosomal protein S6 modification enzyme (glutaminyl transferase) [Desulfurella amilsii]|uniref:Glutathione synthase/Ribosomal protein S6 modification enzyme (Glutaminyl transferase) n=2 Tax=Desulfurella amilsii TaxID=1562698 RepID=A0A1X4XXE9_9BACT|nr:Glutathione synthase/Ribosomal protein S6 modification enzyme (glutaminyl transferase) [Desulfurella amilsii]
MGENGVFRFNSDCFEKYKIVLNNDGFEIRDPLDRIANNTNINKVLYRKPSLKQDLLIKPKQLSDEEDYIDKELYYAAREIINLAWMQRKVVLIEPLVDFRVGKFVQLSVAKKYFNVPNYEFRYNTKLKEFNDRDIVIKSLTMQPIDKKQYLVLYTTKTKENGLSDNQPWMIQEYIDAKYDITVVFIRDKMFAFELDRRNFIDRTVDWRELSVDKTASNWQVHDLKKDIKENIYKFMNDLKLHFGRLDFLYDDKNYYFLEVNPNGQWLWLDPKNKLGVIKKFIEEIHPDTPLNPIPTQVR